MNEIRRDNGDGIHAGSSLICTVEKVWDDISEVVLGLEEQIFEPDLRYTRDDFIEEFHIAGSCFILAAYESSPIGYLHAVPLDGLDYLDFDPGYGKNTSMYVVNIALLTDFRKRDFAASMFEFLKKTTLKKRFTAHAVSDSSRGFFHKIGFVDSGHFPSWMNGVDATYLICEDK